MMIDNTTNEYTDNIILDIQTRISKEQLDDVEDMTEFSDILLIDDDDDHYISINIEDNDHTDKNETVAGIVNVSENDTNSLQLSTTVATTLISRLHLLKHARAMRHRHCIYIYGKEQRPLWGILGLYEYFYELALDLEYVNDVLYRRQHNLPYMAWTEYNALTTNENSFVPFVQRSRPYVMYIIIILSTIMMIVEMARNNWRFESFRNNPMGGPSIDVLRSLGALDAERIVHDHEWYRLMTPLILHAGVIHFGINMIALYMIGATVERIHGSWNTAIIFMIAGVGGCIASALFFPQALSVGASGGIFGLLGMCIADIVTNWHIIRWSNTLIQNDKDCREGGSISICAVVLWAVFEFVLSLIIGFTPYIDNFAHLGGLFYGFGFGYATQKSIVKRSFFRSDSRIRQTWRKTGRLLAALIAVLMLGTTLHFLIHSDDTTESVCPSCRYLSCVPFPFWQNNDKKWWRCDACDYVTGDLLWYEDYGEVDVFCPHNGATIAFRINETMPSESDVRRKLPYLCRTYCTAAK